MVRVQESGMSLVSAEPLPLTTSDHIVIVRQAVRQRAIDLGFSLVDLTKIVTAASDLARHAILHGGGGRAIIESLTDGNRRGLRLTFEDDGPGIANIDLAMRDGYSSNGGLGLGLSGAKRLSNEFLIDSTPGKGTRVV